MNKLLNNIFSIKDYENTHLIMRFMGIKIKFPKKEFAQKKKQNPYYYYKEHNLDITTLPKAEGQIRDIQLANLVLLKELDYVCKKCNLTYWLEYGTLIGAMRHKGYIPWDDDIDTGMIREDYNKLIELFNKNTRNTDLFAGFVRFKQNPCRGVIKIQHKNCPYLFVDVFPYDFYGMELNSEEQIKETVKIHKAWKQMQQKSSFKMDDNKIQEIMKEIREELLQNSCEHSDLMWGMDSYHKENNWIFSYDMMFPLKEIEYENKKYPCINKADEYLRRVFGNYMEYPKKIGFGHSTYAKLTESETNIIKDLIRSLEDDK